MKMLLSKFYMTKERENFRKVIETEYNKPLAITKKDYEDLKNSIKCWIYKKSIWKDNVKVKDHDHITGKNWRSVLQECNLNLIPIKKISAVFYNLKNYINISPKIIGFSIISALLLNNLKRKKLNWDFH